MHPLLARQLRRLGLSAEDPPTSPQWNALVERVSLAYTQNDQDRYTQERSLLLSSREMQKLYSDLRRSEENLRALVERSPDAVFVAAADGTILHVNPALLGCLGYEVASELVGRSVAAFVHADDRARMEVARRSPLSHDSTEPIEVRWSCRDGQTVVVEALTVTIDFDGEPAAMVTGRNVTARLAEAAERERYAHALRLSEERYRILFENCPVAVVVFHPVTRRLLAVNAATSRLYGYEHDELLALRMDDLKFPDDLAELEQGMADVVRPAHPRAAWRGQRRHRRKDGATLDIDVTALPVVLNGELAMLSISHDVTEKRRLEDQLRHAQKMDAVGRLAGGVAHDFNNLLAIILGAAGMLGEGLPDAPQPIQEEIDAIEGAALRAAALTRQLLAVSRTQPRNPSRLDLNVVIAEMGPLLERLIEEHIAMRTELTASLGTIEADARHLEQVLLNLVINARDAMPGGGTIEIATRAVDLDDAGAGCIGARPGRYAMLTVADGGCGMTPEVRARIFEPFFTTKGVGQGTGLGLATVFGIVQESGGAISVESEPGRGTTFRVFLPVVSVAVDAQGTPSAAPIAEKGSGSLLLVEDDLQVREVVGRILSRSGYEVVVTAGPREALEVLKVRSDLQLVITDLVMPTMDGRSMAAIMHEWSPTVRFLFMSGYTEHTAIKGVPLGAEDHFISKPFTPRQLASAVRAALGQSGRGAA